MPVCFLEQAGSLYRSLQRPFLSVLSGFLPETSFSKPIVFLTLVGSSLYPSDSMCDIVSSMLMRISKIKKAIEKDYT